MLLLPVVGPDLCLVSTICEDMKAPRPEVLTHEIPPALAIHPGDVDGTYAFNEATDLGDGIFGLDCNNPMHVVAHNMSFFDPDF